MYRRDGSDSGILIFEISIFWIADHEGNWFILTAKQGISPDDFNKKTY